MSLILLYRAFMPYKLLYVLSIMADEMWYELYII